MTEQTLAMPKTTISARRAPSGMKLLPLVIRLVMAAMIVIFIWSQPFLGFSPSGLAWFIPFVCSTMIVSLKWKKVTFPYVVWLPWVALLAGYLILSDSSLLDPRVSPVQRTVQLLCPLVVGMAISTYRPNETMLRQFIVTFRHFGILILIMVGLKTGVLLTGTIPQDTPLAAEGIAATLLCSFFFTNYSLFGSRSDLLLSIGMLCIPIIALTRTAIAVCLLTFPFCFGPIPLVKRILAVFAIVVVAVSLFYSPRVQKKMFFSGKGSFESIVKGNADFATHGRKFMWEKMSVLAHDNTWAGHGTGAGETFVYRITRNIAYPHNDWLLTFFDYGVIGVSIYALTLTVAALHCLLQLRRNPDRFTRTLLLTGSAGFIPFALMMFTDNIMVYASYFGNLHFCIIGLAYASLKAGRTSKSAKAPKVRPKNHAAPVSL